jgi:hypothetical protein
MDVVIPFHFIECLGVEIHGHMFSSIVFLHQDCASCKCRCIYLKEEGATEIWLSKSRVVENGVNEVVEHCSAFLCPQEWMVLFS